MINFIKKTFTNTVTKAAELCYKPKTTSTFWERAAFTTITLSNMVQVGVIARNKDIPKKEKAFMIPQEITGGIIELTSFILLARGFKKLGQTLVKKGVIRPFKQSAESFSDKFATVTNLAGSLLAINIASPIIRNKIGSKVQKRFYPAGQPNTNIKRNQTFNNLKQNTTFTSFTSNLSI